MKQYENYRDSGIEWLGNVPSHWGVSKFSYVGDMIGGEAFKSAKFITKGIPIIKITNIQNRKVVFNNQKYYKEQENDHNYIIKYNDVLVAMSGATVGKTALFQHKDKIRVVINGFYATLKGSKVSTCTCTNPLKSPKSHFSQP